MYDDLWDPLSKETPHAVFELMNKHAEGVQGAVSVRKKSFTYQKVMMLSEGAPLSRIM